MPRKNKSRLVLTALLLILAGTGGALSAPAKERRSSQNEGMAEEVRHQLAMLPNYSVFDDLAFSIQPGNTVVLYGAVLRPTLKKDAARTVRSVRGVERVINQIEVLPPSPADDRIRARLFRALFSSDQLYRYGLQAVPPIHIIVKNGRVLLTGVVATDLDKTTAGIVANSVPGTFEVKNDLVVERGH